MDFNEIKNTADKYLMPTYGHFPIALTGGKNASLTASDGRVVIDFTSGIGVNIFGVNDDGWKKAVIGQIDKIQHTSNLYITSLLPRRQSFCAKKADLIRCFFAIPERRQMSAR